MGKKKRYPFGSHSCFVLSADGFHLVLNGARGREGRRAVVDEKVVGVIVLVRQVEHGFACVVRVGLTRGQVELERVEAGKLIGRGEH